MTKSNQPSKSEEAKQNQVKPGQTLKPPVNAASQPETKGNQESETPSEVSELEALKAELVAKEAELAEREKALESEGEALKEMRANLDASTQGQPKTDFGVGLMQSDIDLKDAPEEVQRGMHPGATDLEKKAYCQYVREHYKGQTPLKNFLVTIKKGKEVVKQDRVKASDEGDAIRRVYQRIGLAGKTEGYTPHAERVLNVTV